MIKFPTEENASRYLYLVLGAILCLRVISLWFNNSELFFDEAQYWFWAQDPAFGYFSKPPVLAWIIGIFTSVCGSDSSFCIRLFSPFVHTVTAIFIFRTTRILFDSKTGFWAAVLFITLPGISFSSTIASTDVPLLMFWSIALYAYVQLWQRGGMGWGLLFGIALGAGLMSKYAMMYFIGCVFIHALIERNRRHPLFKLEFWIGLIVGAAILVPNILWNMQNGFVTVSHTGDNISWSGFDLNFKGVLEFFGSQFGVFGPLLFGMFLATLWKMRTDSISAAHRMMVAFSVPILLVIVFQALMSKAYANWAAATYVAGCILVAEIMINRIPGFWVKISTAIHFLVFCVVSIAVCFAAPGQLVLSDGSQLFERTQGGSMIGEAVADQLNEYEYRVVLTDGRKFSALLNYYLRDHVEVMTAWRVGDVPNDHYQLVQPYQDFGLTPALFVSSKEITHVLADKFEKVVFVGLRNISAGENRELYLYRLDGYRQ